MAADMRADPASRTGHLHPQPADPVPGDLTVLPADGGLPPASNLSHCRPRSCQFTLLHRPTGEVL